MNLKVKVCGSCGEFIQGFFYGAPTLITCPIEKFSTVEISDEFFEIEGLGKKSLSMLKKTLEILEIKNFNCGIKLKSELPHGKGMASSSADLAAVAKAVALFFGKNITAEKIADLAASIEPTDGIFFKGVVAMNPVTGKFLKNISVPENFSIAIFDYGGVVDTLKFNRRSNFQILAIDDILNFELVEKSALVNQEILYKKNLHEIISFAKILNAVTVNVAHSGTVIGIFFHNDDLNVDAKISEIERRFDCIKFLTKTKLIDGGFYFEKI